MDHKTIIRTLKKHGRSGLAMWYSRKYVPFDEAEEIWRELDEEDALLRPTELAWEKSQMSQLERMFVFEDDHQKYLKEKFEVEARAFHESGEQKMPDTMVKVVKEYKKRFDTVLGLNQSEIESARVAPIDKFAKVVRGFTKCPFHNEKSPSCHITANLFKCFGCGEGGDTISYIMRTQNLDFKRAVKYINEH